MQQKSTNIIAGDFSSLAKYYSENRPDYSSSVLAALTGLIKKPMAEIDFVDIGAGTGIWTRMVANLNPKSVIAVEPNFEMRSQGSKISSRTPIKWLEGSAEKTNLSSNSCDWVSMASSFHWAKFDSAIREFSRILRPDGMFTAIWNPRLLEANPVLSEIENYLSAKLPKSKRVSSGMSGVTSRLTQDLESSELFEDVVYIEARHTLVLSKERYLGIWKSVNDIRAQLGEAEFTSFMNYIEKQISNLDTINATYLTRSWTAQKKIIANEI